MVTRCLLEGLRCLESNTTTGRTSLIFQCERFPVSRGDSRRKRSNVVGAQMDCLQFISVDSDQHDTLYD
jgi:hypothetical protein